MGVLLGRGATGDDRHILLPFDHWPFLLAVADYFGWEPLGTQPTEWTPVEWDGRYDIGEGQYVTPPDAVALARALRAAAASPDLPSAVSSCGESDFGLEASAEAGLRFLGLSGLGEFRSRLAEVAEFCERGGFWLS